MRLAQLVGGFLSLTASLAFSMASAADQVTITRLAGTVTILSDGAKVDAHVGSSLNPPLRIQTGSDGSLHIEQSSSALDIGPDTVVVVPGVAATERIIQEIGRVLYSVKPRKSRSFSVETPYLLSVVKGTTFSVTVEQASTMVALLEGSVEVSAPGSESLLLLPNQSARHAAGERAIVVTKVDTTAPPAKSQRTGATAATSVEPSKDSLADQAAAVSRDLSEITSARSVRGAAPSGGAVTPNPPVTSPPSTGSGSPSTSIPPPGSGPATPPAPPSAPDIPTLPPIPDPTPLPTPGDTAGEDDHNNGHGNDEDGHDESNPGKGRGKRDHR
jgi:hypothetical protein